MTSSHTRGIAATGVARALASLACAIVIVFALPTAAQDIANGKALFEQCIACHTLDGAKSETGPSLKGLFGRKFASVDDFIYSPAMRRANDNCHAASAIAKNIRRASSTYNAPMTWTWATCS